MAGDNNTLLKLCGATRTERDRLAHLPTEPRALLRQQIELLALRERRAMRAMAALKRLCRNSVGALEEHTQKDSRTCGKAAADSEQTVSEHSTRRRSIFDARQELEAQLNKLNEQKLKAIELLARLDERQSEQQPGVRFSICIPDNGRARVEPEAGPDLAGLEQDGAEVAEFALAGTAPEFGPEFAVQ